YWHCSCRGSSTPCGPRCSKSCRRPWIVLSGMCCTRVKWPAAVEGLVEGLGWGVLLFPLFRITAESRLVCLAWALLLLPGVVFWFATPLWGIAFPDADYYFVRLPFLQAGSGVLTALGFVAALLIDEGERASPA